MTLSMEVTARAGMARVGVKNNQHAGVVAVFIGVVEANGGLGV